MSYWIFSAISIEVPLKIICLHHPFARYFKMSKYVVLDTERYNNKMLPILKNDISTFFLQKFFRFLITSISHPFESYISILQDTSREERRRENLKWCLTQKKIIRKKHLIVTVSSIIFSIKILWYKKHQFYLRKMTSCVFFLNFTNFFVIK